MKGRVQDFCEKKGVATLVQHSRSTTTTMTTMGVL